MFKRIFIIGVFILASACAAPPAVPTPPPATLTTEPTATTRPNAPTGLSGTPRVNRADAPTLAPSDTPTVAATSTQSPSSTPTATDTPTPTLNPLDVCNELTARGQPGLYIVSIEPFPALAWDWDPRQFRVQVCNTLSRSTSPDGRFIVFVYFPGEKSPRGQTSQVPFQLPPGLSEISLGSWVPGMENHISACNAQPPVEFAVAYTLPPDRSILHPVPYADGHDRRIFTLQCGGHFP